MKSLAKLLSLILLILSLNTGCNKTIKTLALNNAEWLVMYQVDDYFDLTSEQYDRLEPRAKVHLRWAQKELTPEIIVELKKIVALDRKLQPEEIDGYYFSRTRGLWIKLVDHLAEDGAKLFGDLSKEQYEYLEELSEERYEKWNKLSSLNQEEYLEGYEELQEERLEKLEDWVGEVSDQQIKEIIKVTFITQEEYKREAVMMKQVRSEFIKRVRAAESIDKRAKFLKSWTREPQVPNQEAYLEYRAWRKVKQNAFWKKLEEILTPEQHAHRKKKLAELIKDLEYFQKVKY